MILLTSLGEGARRYITGEFTTLGSNLLIVIPGKTETRGLAKIAVIFPPALIDWTGKTQVSPQFQRLYHA